MNVAEVTPQKVIRTNCELKMLTQKDNKIARKGDYTPIEVESVFRKKRQETMNLNGWGFTDSIFTYDKGVLSFTGNR